MLVILHLLNKVGSSVFFLQRSRRKKHYLPRIIEMIRDFQLHLSNLPGRNGLDRSNDKAPVRDENDQDK